MCAAKRKLSSDAPRIVFSTQHGEHCPSCGAPALSCECAEERRPDGKSPVIVRRETKGRAGKGVTAIHGLPLLAAELEGLCKELKKRCGTGGTVKDGVIEIQGEHRELLVRELEARGYRPKRA